MAVTWKRINGWIQSQKKQVNDMDQKNMERSNDVEIIIEKDEDTDMSPSVFIGLLKSQVKDLR